MFLAGASADPSLIAVLIGRQAAGEPARIEGYALAGRHGGAVSGLVPASGLTEGVFLDGLSQAEAARVDFYHAVLGMEPRPAEVILTDGRTRDALVHAYSANDAGDPRWDEAVWRERWAPTVAGAAADIVQAIGALGSERLGARYPLLLIRAGARVRAEREPRPTGLRFRAGPGDIAEVERRTPYASYFAVEETDLRFRRFDGKLNNTLTRAVFISGDASVVLPYDPVRDRVLVIEQFRAGPHARGDAQPWLIEAVAGRVDGGETPEEAAIREAHEEAGVAIERLIPAARYYPSPAAKAEYLYTFIGLADLPDKAAGIGGLPGEGEDIRGHLLSFKELIELAETGEIDNAPLLILALKLREMRPGLRAGR